MTGIQRLAFALPTSSTQQILVGAVFAESSTKWWGGEDDEEKAAIAWTILNMSYYAKQRPFGKSHCYNTAFGDGSILGAITKAIVAYGKDQWNLVMQGSALKAPATLASKLTKDQTEHLKLVADVVKVIGSSPALPHALATLQNRIPVQFNRASNAPPSEDRQEKIGQLGRHTFYGFKSGRECE